MLNLKKIKLYFSNLPAYFVVLLFLFLAGSLSFVLSKNVVVEKNEIAENNSVEKNNLKPTKKIEADESSEAQNLQESYIATNSHSSDSSTTQATSYMTASSTTSIGESNSSPNPGSTNSVAGNKVSISINGGSSLEIKISEGSNQCDVLVKALEQGKIQSLNMRYDNSLGSYAVYQINGIGKENTVWWTYKVNGNSPSQGCSYTKANNGDNIEWRYIGQ